MPDDPITPAETHDVRIVNRLPADIRAQLLEIIRQENA